MTGERDAAASGPDALRRLRHDLRRALPGVEPGLRVLAEGLPASPGSIDLLGTDADGRLVLVFIATDVPAGAERDATGALADGTNALALARALGVRAWVRSEMPGWLQLVPDLAITPRTETRCLLLVRALSPTLRAAIDALPARWVEPLVYRPFSHRGDAFVLLEQAARAAAVGAIEAEGDAPADEPPVAAPDPASPSPAATRDGDALPAFRSGLTEADFEACERGRRPARPPGHAPRPRFDASRPDRAAAPEASGPDRTAPPSASRAAAPAIAPRERSR